MDIVAKHVAPDANGVRIAELDEVTYRKLLWSHRPLTDFWQMCIRDRKNAVLKGTNLQEGATMQERNNQIGGHHA